MIYIGALIVSQKVVKDTAKGTKYNLTAEDTEGNKLTLKFTFENFTDFKALAVGDVLDPKKIEWQGQIEGSKEGQD